MISSASHDSVSRLVADRSMCLATALDKAFENIDCMIRSCAARQRIAFMNQLNALSNRVEYYGFQAKVSGQTLRGYSSCPHEHLLTLRLGKLMLVRERVGQIFGGNGLASPGFLRNGC